MEIKPKPKPIWNTEKRPKIEHREQNHPDHGKQNNSGAIWNIEISTSLGNTENKENKKNGTWRTEQVWSNIEHGEQSNLDHGEPNKFGANRKWRITRTGSTEQREQNKPGPWRTEQGRIKENRTRMEQK